MGSHLLPKGKCNIARTHSCSLSTCLFLWCKTQPADNVDHPLYLFFYQRQFWLLKYLRDLLAVESPLQTAGVCSRVLDESFTMCFQRMILLQKKFGCANCPVCGQLKPGMTISPSDASILQRLIRACIKKLNVREKLVIYQARWQPDITQGVVNRENATLLLLSLWRKGRHERAQSRYASRWRFCCC